MDVRITFAGSQVLRLQIEQGAPADVFASANPAHMAALVDAGLAEAASVFAYNDLVVIVPKEDEGAIGAFEGLPDAPRIVLGTTAVPVGRYARESLERASAELGAAFADAVMERVASEESNVRLARAKVELGEADAAIVYRTDAASSPGVRIVEIPDRWNVRASYVIGIVRRDGTAATGIHPAAQAWIDLVRSDTGRAVLSQHGFGVE